ncbi:MAG: HD domain-containing protein [Bacilli bacterium]|nr:HD domain-containing protein [Bacilli bacterium]
MKKDSFKVELDKFENDNIRVSAETMLEMLPDYFFEIPASSSGRFHPAFSLGEGGLVRHVKVAMRLLEEIFRDEVFGTYDSHTKDLMRMALLLHDGFKSGVVYSGHTNPDHPVIMHDFILKNKEKLLINEKDAEFVANLILSHMGPWNKDKDGHEIMPVPKTREERIIHECDYFASRNFLNVHFIDNEIADSAERGKVFQKKENEVTN